jgi:O-antigen ligase
LAVLLLGGFIVLFGGESFLVQSMGRQSNLSGRTEIWAALIPVAHNALLGAGFESFWISSGAVEFHHTLALQGWYQPQGLNEAHNGYLEVYLNLGVLGLGLIALILTSGYRLAVAAFRRNASIGGLMTGYIIVAVFYNITEAGLRMMGVPWIFLLLAILTSSGVASGVIGEEGVRLLTSRRVSALGAAVKGGIKPGKEIAHAVEVELVNASVGRQQELFRLSEFLTWRREVGK